MAEIMAVLYGRILNVSPETKDSLDRDRFILSKGHAAAGYYAALAECGFFPVEWLDTFYLDGGRLAGHATCGIPGIEISSGSLGHGLSMATGIAISGKLDDRAFRTFALLSDGECQEGSTWEAAMFAAHHKLDNIIAIVDYNKIQALGYTKEVCDLEPFVEKWRSFGWSVREVDGHNVSTLVDALESIPFEISRPSCIIAHTIKGKGVSFTEDSLLWHYRCPRGEEFDAIMAELDEGTHQDVVSKNGGQS